MTSKTLNTINHYNDLQEATMATTIQISEENKSRLDKIKLFERETYNEIIERILEDEMTLNEKTKKELALRKKNKDFVSHKDVKKRFGL